MAFLYRSVGEFVLSWQSAISLSPPLDVFLRIQNCLRSAGLDAVKTPRLCMVLWYKLLPRSSAVWLHFGGHLATSSFRNGLTSIWLPTQKWQSTFLEIPFFLSLFPRYPKPFLHDPLSRSFRSYRGTKSPKVTIQVFHGNVENLLLTGNGLFDIGVKDSTILHSQ